MIGTSLATHFVITIEMWYAFFRQQFRTYCPWVSPNQGWSGSGWFLRGNFHRNGFKWVHSHSLPVQTHTRENIWVQTTWGQHGHFLWFWGVCPNDYNYRRGSTETPKSDYVINGWPLTVLWWAWEIFFDEILGCAINSVVVAPPLCGDSSMTRSSLTGIHPTHLPSGWALPSLDHLCHQENFGIPFDSLL